MKNVLGKNYALIANIFLTKQTPFHIVSHDPLEVSSYQCQFPVFGGFAALSGISLLIGKATLAFRLDGNHADNLLTSDLQKKTVCSICNLSVSLRSFQIKAENNDAHQGILRDTKQSTKDSWEDATPAPPSAVCTVWNHHRVLPLLLWALSLTFTSELGSQHCSVDPSYSPFLLFLLLHCTQLL